MALGTLVRQAVRQAQTLDRMSAKDAWEYMQEHGPNGDQFRGDLMMSLDEWAQLFSSFSYNGLQYPFIPQTGLSGRETVGAGFTGFVQSAYRANGVVFACMMVRMLLFSEARFQFQQMNGGRPGKVRIPWEMPISMTSSPGG